MTIDNQNPSNPLESGIQYPSSAGIYQLRMEIFSSSSNKVYETDFLIDIKSKTRFTFLDIVNMNPLNNEKTIVLVRFQPTTTLPVDGTIEFKFHSKNNIGEQLISLEDLRTNIVATSLTSQYG